MHTAMESESFSLHSMPALQAIRSVCVNFRVYKAQLRTARVDQHSG